MASHIFVVFIINCHLFCHLLVLFIWQSLSIIVPNIKRILQIQQNLLSMQIVNFIANAISKYNEHFNLLHEVNQHQILTQEF